MTNPYAPPQSAPTSSTRSCFLLVVGFVAGLLVGSIVVPVLVIGSLTVLGQQISAKFEKICQENPNDPACKK